jgi:hypothetical protein
MDVLPFPSWPYLAAECITYPLTFLCLRHSWLRDRPLFFVMLASMLFGFVVEYSQVIKHPLPYYYTEAIITLPGPVPLGVVLGWCITFFAVIQTSRWLGVSWKVQPFVSGLLAVNLDLITDPAFVAIGFWVWNLPGNWYGIPWDNYVGWMVIVSSFVFCINLAYRWFPEGEKTWRDALIAFAAVIPAFLMFMLIMVSYVALVGLKLPWLPEVIMVVMVFSLYLAIVLPQIPHMKRDHEVVKLVLAVPIAFFATGLVILFGSGLFLKQQELIIVMPVLILLGILSFSWPYLDTILNKAKK